MVWFVLFGFLVYVLWVGLSLGLKVEGWLGYWLVVWVVDWCGSGWFGWDDNMFVGCCEDEILNLGCWGIRIVFVCDCKVCCC